MSEITPPEGMSLGDQVASQVWGTAVASIQECTPICMNQLHVDDIVVVYTDAPIAALNDHRAKVAAEAALRGDGQGEAAVRLIKPLIASDELLFEAADAQRKVLELAGVGAKAQVCRVWYFRARH
jgi:hypothetical protein